MSKSDKGYEPGSPEAAELWRQARVGEGPGSGPGTGPGTGPEAPDPLLIAAYVAGTLDPQARDRVEAWMAGSSDALDLVLAARAAHAGTPPGTPAPAPPELLARAQGLVRPPAGVDTGRQGTIGDWFVGMAPPSMWAATAAAMVFAAVVSFELGRETTVKLAATQTLTVAAVDDDGADDDGADDDGADDDGLGFGSSSGDLL